MLNRVRTFLSKPQNVILLPKGFTLQSSGGRLVVASVQPNGPANFLRRGDVLAGIGGKALRSQEELLQVFRQLRLAGQILLQVERGGRLYYARLLP